MAEPEKKKRRRIVEPELGDPFAEGYDAAGAGVEKKANPHLFGGDSWNLWNSGWDQLHIDEDGEGEEAPAVPRLDSLRPHYREALACFEAFCRLGYTPEHIFLNVTEHGSRCAMQMVLRPTDGKEFVVDVAHSVSGALRAVADGWKVAAQLWEAAPKNERRQLWESSELRGRLVEMLAAMERKGFLVDRDAVS